MNILIYFIVIFSQIDETCKIIGEEISKKINNNEEFLFIKGFKDIKIKTLENEAKKIDFTNKKLYFGQNVLSEFDKFERPDIVFDEYFFWSDNTCGYIDSYYLKTDIFIQSKNKIKKFDKSFCKKYLSNFEPEFVIKNKYLKKKSYIYLFIDGIKKNTFEIKQKYNAILFKGMINFERINFNDDVFVVLQNGECGFVEKDNILVEDYQDFDENKKFDLNKYKKYTLNDKESQLLSFVKSKYPDFIKNYLNKYLISINFIENYENYGYTEVVKRNGEYFFKIYIDSNIFNLNAKTYLNNLNNSNFIIDYLFNKVEIDIDENISGLEILLFKLTIEGMYNIKNNILLQNIFENSRGFTEYLIQILENIKENNKSVLTTKLNDFYEEIENTIYPSVLSLKDFDSYIKEISVYCYLTDFLKSKYEINIYNLNIKSYFYDFIDNNKIKEVCKTINYIIF